WMVVEEEGLRSPISKFLTQEEMDGLRRALEAETGDLLLLMADKPSLACEILGRLRLHLGQQLNLIPEGRWDFVWIVNWPLLEKDEETGRWSAAHHPFTAPVDEDLERLETDPGSVRAKAYDLVLNGNEIGGGSIRIHRRDVQERMFRV